MSFEVSWVQDDRDVWHQCRHPLGYVESTNPWSFTTVCGQAIDTATPPLPAAPIGSERCSECDASDKTSG